MKQNLFMKRTLFATALILSCAFASAQTIRFKTDYNAPKSSSTLKFETASFSGTLKSSNNEIELKVKNNGSHHFTSKTAKISLKDITGRGFNLCSEDVVKLAPGDRKNMTLTNCKNGIGLFFLDTQYSSNMEFEEDAFFLRGKEWTLTIGGETFTFYTDI